MVKKIVKLSALLPLFMSACSSTNSKPLFIGFSADSTAIVFSHITPAGLLQLKNTQPADSVFNHLIAVLQTPSEKDTSIKEMPIAGKVFVTDSNIVFKPAVPFVKGNDYLVITHLNSNFGNAEKIVSGKLSYLVKPIQKVLTR